MTTLQSRQLESSLQAEFSASGVRVSAEAPLELRGPFWQGGRKTYFLRNVTAGMFAGDRYQIAASAEAGASVRIGSTSATKVHAMPAGYAVSEVILRAEPDSSLTWGTHASILQTGSDVRQSIQVTLQPGARVLLAEVIALGRTARGEHCDFKRFQSELVVTDGSRPLYEERYAIERGPSLATALGGFHCIASVHALGIVTPPAALGEILGDAYAGYSTLPHGAGIAVRALITSLSDGIRLADSCLEILQG